MRGRAFGLGLVSLLALVARARAAAAEGAQASAVWYRAAAECPSGADFLAKIEGTPRAHLAQGGEHIDFVVTLLTAGAETVGRLERQTNGGTVAIRELRDATCERVADGLALSLGLALEPTQTGSTPPATPGQPEQENPAPTAAPDDTAPTPRPVSSVPAATVARPSAVAAPPPSPGRRQAQSKPAVWVGLDGGALSGPATHPMPRGSAFVAIDRVLPALAHDLSLRFGVVAALGSSRTAIGDVQRWVLAARADACPWRFGTESVAVLPCLAFELGASGASSAGATGVDDRSLWAAPGAGLRLSLGLTRQLRLEASAGALLPVLREQIFAGSRALYQDAIIAFYGSLGVSFGLP
jgi:hypothetical protein